jgi:hypothetical protein
MFIWRRRELVRPRYSATIDAEHATVDRGGGFAGELLVDDRATDGIEVSALCRSRKPKPTDALNDGAERWIGGGQVAIARRGERGSVGGDDGTTEWNRWRDGRAAGLPEGGPAA